MRVWTTMESGGGFGFTMFCEPPIRGPGLSQQRRGHGCQPSSGHAKSKKGNDLKTFSNECWYRWHVGIRRPVFVSIALTIWSQASAFTLKDCSRSSPGKSQKKLGATSVWNRKNFKDSWINSNNWTTGRKSFSKQSNTKGKQVQQRVKHYSKLF